MASMTDYLENKLIDFLFRGGSFTAPANLYVALYTVAPNDTGGGTEVTGGNYARQQLNPAAANWYSTQATTDATSTGTGGTTGNVSSLAWNGVTWTGTVVAVGILDASSGGNLLFYKPLASSKTLASGDSISFGANALTVQIDN